jgi:glutathione peroxidase
MNSMFYSFSANSIKGEEISMSDFKDKVVVIVNTASKCGFTPQYEGLELLYKKYGAQGLVILGFPCNQFGKQEPGSAEEISQGCLVNYGVTFPMFEKIEVNGKGAHPLYIYLKKALPGFLSGRIKWNFTKFVIDRNGNAIKRFAPYTTPLQMEEYLRELL